MAEDHDNNVKATGKPCSGLRAELLKCLRESDCVVKVETFFTF